MLNPIKFLARTLLAGVFIGGGLNQLKLPTVLGPVVEKEAAAYGLTLPTEGANVVRANGAGMIAAGAAMALGIKPRLSALALIGMLAPTTVVGHPFWKMDDPQAAAENRNGFFANTAIIGGLLMVALDRR